MERSFPATEISLIFLLSLIPAWAPIPCFATSSAKEYWRKLDEGDAVQDKGMTFESIDMGD